MILLGSSRNAMNRLLVMVQQEVEVLAFGNILTSSVKLAELYDVVANAIKWIYDHQCLGGR
jgi:hypothetical protein